MQTILITGGTGMIGKALTTHLLGKGYNVIILTRRLSEATISSPNLTQALWNVKNQTIDIDAVQKADHIIHLAGAGVVDKKWTAAYKKEIQQSRTESSQLIVTTLKNNPGKVKTIVSASAIGWYGADAATAATPFSETAAPANDFLGATCKLWEQSISPVESMQIRLVKLRTGIVLGNEGGALAEFKKPLKLGVAAILGTGQQVVSWIHMEDLCRMYTTSIENENLSGAYNAVAPFPVTNKTFTLALAKAMNGKFFIPLHVPAFILQLMMGTRSIEVLKSTTVSSEKIQQAGFSFLYATIESAFKQLCGR